MAIRDPNPKPVNTNCPGGTQPPQMQYLPLPSINAQACLRVDVNYVKECPRKHLKDALGNQLGLQPVNPNTWQGDYYSYVRVVPKAVADAAAAGTPLTNCSCMCGCS